MTWTASPRSLPNLPIRAVCSVLLFFALLFLALPGYADPVPIPAAEQPKPTITQQGDNYLIDEANGISVEVSPKTGLFRYFTIEDGRREYLFEGSSKTAASVGWIFNKALDICDPILVRLWIQQFPEVLKQSLPGRKDYPALICVITNRHWSPNKRIPFDIAGVVEVLLDAGGDPNKGAWDSSPLSLAAWPGNLDVIKTLVSHGAQVNAPNGQGQTPRYAALLAGQREIADFLREHGGELVQNGAPIHKAAADGDVEALTKILKDTPFARNELTPRTNYTPLMLAAFSSQLPAVKVLLDAGADVNIAGFLGETPLYFASASGSLEVVLELLKHDANTETDRRDAERDPTPLLTDIYHMYWSQTSGRQPDAEITKRRVEIARALLAHGAKPDAFLTRPYEGGALHIVAELGNVELAELLIAAHAAVDGRDRRDLTPLCHAVQAHQLTMVDCLISHGADVNARTKEGKSVLQFCSKDDPVYGFLVRHGATVEQVKLKGK